jgi:signal transduction histidine kinase/CheY-like chemotaxis protein
MRVLLVEDNEGDADLVRAALGGARGADIELAHVTRIDTARERLESERFDVVLLDLSLPDAHGFDGLARLQRAALNAPIVVLTGLDDPLAGERALQHGAHDYLQKGVEGSEVLRALRYARERAQYLERARLLADVGVAVSSSLDTRVMLAAFERTLTNGYADSCSVEGADAEDAGETGPAARGPVPPSSLYAAFDEERSDGPEDARLGVLRSRGVSSAIVVPFRVEGWASGVVTFARKPLSKPYSHADVALAEEITRRVGSALTHAGLVLIAQRDRDRAEIAGRLRDEFLATLSHELRTPLSAILGWTQLLRTGRLPPGKQAKALETIERNARSQVTLIEDVLDVSRIITGKFRLNLSVVDLGGLLGAALDTVRPAAEAKGIGLRLLPDAAGTLRGDPDRLLQVLWNLLANAVKFTPRGGSVSVDVRPEGSCLEVSVADTGQGIDPIFLPHVFERFRQADSSFARSHGGLGLGLAITRHLVEAQGGTIRAESPGVGQGSTFTVRFPTSALRAVVDVAGSSSGQSVANGSKAEMPGASLAGVSVLVVDDDADSRTILQSLLESCDAFVATASSAEEALGAIAIRPPDVLISDIGMPGATGHDLVRRLRALPPSAGGRTPAVALTAYASAETRTSALSLGFDHFVTKPVEPSELVAVVFSLAHPVA